AIDLLRSRPGFFVHASVDGKTWTPTQRLPAVEAAVKAETPDSKKVREDVEAQRLELQLDRYREFTPHQIFGVPPNATLKDFRRGFTERAKHVHPGRLPKDVSPALLRAQMATYQYFSEVMANVEKRFANQESVAAKEAQSASTTPPVGVAPKQPVWTLETLHLVPGNNNELVGGLDITRDTAVVFSMHRLMNLQNSSAFFPCNPTLQLGTKLALSFRFIEANRTVDARAAVALESTFADEKAHLRGFGVRLDGVNQETKGFMLREVQRITAPPRR
ncbi:MAG: hypothetical protein JNG84_15610, partial [Archangium sp.]|nr:hypothetical protein [Archangium sp.]